MANIDNLKLLIATVLNLFKFLDKNPAAFDVQIYKAKNAVMEQTATGVDPVGSLEPQERMIEYDSPTAINRALIVQEDMPGIASLVGFGMDELEDGEPVVKMLINDIEITEGSIIVYEKVLAYSAVDANQQNQRFERRVSKVQPVGTPPAFNIYHTVPLAVEGVV